MYKESADFTMLTADSKTTWVDDQVRNDVSSPYQDDGPQRLADDMEQRDGLRSFDNDVYSSTASLNYAGLWHCFEKLCCDVH